MNVSHSSPWQEAEKYLSRQDENMKELIAKHGPCPLTPRQPSEYFSALCESIISQQLATKAANAICDRFMSHFGNDPTPELVARCQSETLRAIGLSGQKTAYMLDLAQKFLDGHITPQHFTAMTDQQIIIQLTSVKGIGLWTVQIFLMFALNRPDIFPADDLGIKKAIQILNQLPALPERQYMLQQAEPWHPYATAASWYLWRSLDNK